MRKILLLGVIFNSAAAALAVCLWPFPPSTCAEYFRSSLVVEGTAIARKHLTYDELGPDAATDGELYTFKVDSVYRGQAGRTVQLVNRNDSGRIGFSIRVGGKYLLFLGKDADSGWYAADGCGNSGSSNGRPRTFAQIKALERAKDGGLIEVNVYIAEGAGLRGPLADLPVTLVGTESVTAKTDKDGWARFRVPLGTYAARASNPEWGVTQFDMTYEDAGRIQLTEHGQCSQVQLIAQRR